MAKVFKSILDLFQEISEAAYRDNAPRPVISTDYRTAEILRTELGSAIGGPPFGTWTMYDGIEIKVDAASYQRDEWREHFGPLTEMWSA